MPDEREADIATVVAEAIACYRAGDPSGATRRAVAVVNAEARAEPRDRAVCHQLLGLIAHRGGRLEEAIDHLRRAVALQPQVAQLGKDLASAHRALAKRLRAQSKFARAEEEAREALRRQPNDPDAQSLLGVTLHDQEKLAEARECLEGGLAASPRHAPLRLNYANLLAALGETEAAIESYRLALALRPNHVKTLLGAGAALLEAKRSRPAAQLLERAVQLERDNAEAHFNLANAYVGCKRLPDAVESYESALRLRPSWAIAHANWMRERAEIGDWRDDWHAEMERLLRTLAEELDAGRPSPLNVSQTPGLPVPAPLMRRIARQQTERLRRRREARGGHATSPPVRAAARPRLRIGYLSGDFRHNAIGHLTRSMFGHHDRERFEVFTYSYGPDDASDYRTRIQEESEHFVDLFEQGDAPIAERIAADAIDILVDITGYAGNGRPGVLVSRPAPVLVHYLGFPGSLGGLVDYFVTDPIITPPGSALRDEFEEALLYLPHTYQMTDDRQPVAADTPTREACGLPEEGFVFAAFNNNYKIQPEIFDVWMRILRAVPDSVLWLVRTQPEAAESYVREAECRGVAKTRLVFADILPKPEHLARHALADLFLDTTVCGAHTTATDALWAGLPVLTRPGSRFAERVAASLLAAADLQDLIVGDLSEYEAAAIELATHPRRCRDLREDWSRRRAGSRLFDTAGRVRELERGYDAIWQRYREGLRPQDLECGGDEGPHDCVDSLNGVG